MRHIENKKYNICLSISMKTLNVNQKAEIVRLDLEQTNKETNKIHLYAVYRRHTRFKDTSRLDIKGWKKINHSNSKQKKAGMLILISDKIEFKTKNVTRDKERHFIILKRLIHQEDITIMNI